MKKIISSGEERRRGSETGAAVVGDDISPLISRAPLCALHLLHLKGYGRGDVGR